MPRIQPIPPGDSSDPEANNLLAEAVDGWWQDAALFGLVARRPGLLKAIVGVFREMFTGGTIEPYLKDLMRIRTGIEWQCAYRLTVRSVAVRDQTAPLEEAVRTLDPDKFNSRREYLAVNFAAHLADRPFRVTDALIADLREEFTDDEIAEMAICCGMFSWGNIVGIGLRVDLANHEHYPPLDWDEAEQTKREQTLADVARLARERGAPDEQPT